MPTSFKDLQRRLKSSPPSEKTEEEESLTKTIAKRLTSDDVETPSFQPIINKPLKTEASVEEPAAAALEVSPTPAVKPTEKALAQTAAAEAPTAKKTSELTTRIEDYSKKADGLPPSDREFFKTKLAELQSQLANSEKDLDRRELVEKLSQAVTQLGAGLYGLKTGSDLSGLKFSTTDWSKKYDQALSKFKLGVESLKDERDRFDRAEQFQETVRQQELNRGQQADQFNRKLEVDKEANRIKKELAAGAAAKKTDTEKVKYEGALRDEWTKNPVTKDTEKVVTSYRKIQQATKNPSAAGDIALIFGYMKMLDPTSVVREGEAATAQNAGGVDDMVRNTYNRVLSGQRLTQDQRADFANQAKGQLQAQLETQEIIDRRYRTLAVKNELDPTNVIDTSFQDIVPRDTRTVNGVTYRRTSEGWERVK